MGKIVRARVTGRPTYINSVLYMPGEVASVDLEALGVDKLGDKTPGLEAFKGEEPVIETPVAAVAPHAPDAPNAQGLPTGTVQSGTGRLVQVNPQGDAPTEAASAEPETIQPVGADKPDVAGEQTPAKPTKK